MHLLLAQAGAFASDQTPIRVHDAAGRTVELSRPASRIVALAPHIVENLFAIDAGDVLLAAVDYSDHPPAARELPRVGGIVGISLEAIVAQRPDLVLAWGSGTDPAILAALESLGLPYYVDEIRSLDELAQSISNLGAITGHSESARRAVERIRTTIDAVTCAGVVERNEVFLQIWDQPLQSVGRDHLLTEVIARCGGRSVTAALPGLAPQVSLEAILAADPALIVVESVDQAKPWLRFPTLSAVAHGRIAVIDPDLLHRPTLRLLEGMKQLCAALRADN
ncbi:MAG: cobalamin-binding protein [Halieaceae bacterium]|jgi:iron complex transport system substrate-binding protein|nr:cobalamin-binding protein [Halieaceae bacterium]